MKRLVITAVVVNVALSVAPPVPLAVIDTVSDMPVVAVSGMSTNTVSAACADGARVVDVIGIVTFQACGPAESVNVFVVLPVFVSCKVYVTVLPGAPDIACDGLRSTL